MNRISRFSCLALWVPGMAAAAEGSVDASALVRMIVGLLVVIAAIIALAWFMRRLGNIGPSATGQLKVVGGLAVGQRERVVLVQVGQQQLLLGVAPGRVQTLYVLDEPLAPMAAGGEQGGAFAERLRRALQQQGGRR